MRLRGALNVGTMVLLQHQMATLLSFNALPVFLQYYNSPNTHITPSRHTQLYTTITEPNTSLVSLHEDYELVAAKVRSCWASAVQHAFCPHAFCPPPITFRIWSLAPLGLDLSLKKIQNFIPLHFRSRPKGCNTDKTDSCGSTMRFRIVREYTKNMGPGRPSIVIPYLFISS
jgi:hypothetical protein